MNKREEIEKKTTDLVGPILDEASCSLYDVEYVREGKENYLRVYIDKEGGVTIDDCEVVSRALSDKLDEKDYIRDAYILEVSSPGLGRTLKKDAHLEKSIGEKVEISTFRKIDGQKEFSGVLTSFDSSSITVIDEENKELTFSRSDISLIRLAFDF